MFEYDITTIGYWPRAEIKQRRYQHRFNFFFLLSNIFILKSADFVINREESDQSSKR